jgi:hypothetical protein
MSQIFERNFVSSYLLNTQNECVCIVKTRGMNMFVYWEYAEQICTYTENTQNSLKVENLGEFESTKS